MVSLIPKMVFNQNEDGALRVYDALMQSRYSNQLRTTSENLKPVHDAEIADFRAAAENFAVNFGRIIRNQRADVHNSEDRSFAARIIKQLRV